VSDLDSKHQNLLCKEIINYDELEKDKPLFDEPLFDANDYTIKLEPIPKCLNKTNPFLNYNCVYPLYSNRIA
jgi:hypothetical protein